MCDSLSVPPAAHLKQQMHCVTTHKKKSETGERLERKINQEVNNKESRQIKNALKLNYIQPKINSLGLQTAQRTLPFLG